MAMWDRIHAIRDDAQKALEIARTDKVIGASLEAKVTLFCDKELYGFAKSVEGELPGALIVSQVEILNEGTGDFKGDLNGLTVSVGKASGEKCERCWMYSDTVGQNPEHPTLCARCAGIME